MKKIDNDLLLNQQDHDNFRTFQIELEEQIRLASYGAEYKLDEVNFCIGKKPKLLSAKNDGPDIFSTLGDLANDIEDFPSLVAKEFNRHTTNQKIVMDKYKNEVLQL